MYGDTTVIRALAARLREQGDDIRTEASRLLGQVEHTPWTGVAADTMRHRAWERAGDLRHAARLHDDAAQALDHHADEVDRLEALIAVIEHRVLGLVEAAKDRIGSIAGHLLGDAGSALDHLLSHVDLPPHGSLAWLHLDLPGISL